MEQRQQKLILLSEVNWPFQVSNNSSCGNCLSNWGFRVVQFFFHLSPKCKRIHLQAHLENCHERKGFIGSPINKHDNKGRILTTQTSKKFCVNKVGQKDKEKIQKYYKFFLIITYQIVDYETVSLYHFNLFYVIDCV